MISRRAGRLIPAWTVLLLATAAAAEPVRMARLRVNDLTYDRVTKRIYASLIPDRPVMRYGLAAIDLDTGKIEFPFSINAELGKLAIAGQGRYLYAAIDGGASVLRFDTVNQTAGLRFSTDNGSGANAVD